MINRIMEIKNIGKFLTYGFRNEEFNKTTLIYAENGRGKTTLSSIFRELRPNLVYGDI